MITLRLPLSIISNPQATLVDQETGFQPSIFTSSDLGIQFCVFDPTGTPIDITTIAYVQADFVSPFGTILLSVSLSGSSLVQCSTFNWQTGVSQQGTFVFTADQLSSLCANSPSYYAFGGPITLSIYALDIFGNRQVWGYGPVNVNNAGVGTTVKMPLIPVPAVIPKGALYEIPAGVVIVFPTSPKIFGQLICDASTATAPQGAFTITAT